MRLDEFLSLSAVQAAKITELSLYDRDSSLTFEDLTTEQWTSLKHAFAQCCSLITLDLSHSSLSSLTLDQLRNLKQALVPCRNLTSLNLTCNALYAFSLDQLQILKQMLTQCRELTSLEVSGNNLGRLTADKWLAFCEALATCTKLISLDLSCNKLGQLNPTEWQALGRVFTQFRVLSSLNLYYNSLTDCSTNTKQAFYRALSQCYSLTFLNLSSVNLFGRNPTLTEMEIFCQALVQWPGLTSLNLAGNGLGELNNHFATAWQMLCHTLGQLRALLTLNLSQNHLRHLASTDWRLFSQVLSKCEALITLDLNENYLNFLRTTSLTPWGDSPSGAFLHALAQSKSLLNIDVSGDDPHKHASVEQKNQIQKLLATNRARLPKKPSIKTNTTQQIIIIRPKNLVSASASSVSAFNNTKNETAIASAKTVNNIQQVHHAIPTVAVDLVKTVTPTPLKNSTSVQFFSVPPAEKPVFTRSEISEEVSQRIDDLREKEKLEEEARVKEENDMRIAAEKAERKKQLEKNLERAEYYYGWKNQPGASQDDVGSSIEAYNLNEAQQALDDFNNEGSSSTCSMM